MPSPSDFEKQIGLNIKNRRQYLGWTQQKLANEAFLSKSTVSRNEKGGGLNLSTIENYAKALRCSENDITRVQTSIDPYDVFETTVDAIRKLPSAQRIQYAEILNDIMRLKGTA
ncbi:MAG: helix-turn-helix transcriptional regulator [Clostridia bacterium]|nr:helix-turn-helix transcriptional regulator [Clostridia bacterium]MBR1559590.1 helix-turn-helix transcriptional regulator [Clostridia bacterium]